MNTNYKIVIPFKIIKINAIDSSNNEIKRLYHNKLHLNGLVVWAKKQTDGRGQGSKKWLSHPNRNLTFSIFLNGENVSFSSHLCLNLITSLSVRKVLMNNGINDLFIKWPNDILSVNKKISGILIENLYKGKKLMGSIVGVGINVNQVIFPKNFNASSMKIITSNEFSLKKTLHDFLDIFNRNLLLYSNFDLLKKDFNKSLFRKNEIIEYEINGNIKKGEIIGLYDHDRFQILCSSGLKETPRIRDVKIIY
ncbi:MAG: biotin--[acetyl-CoA-carboxylase] ligase [Flavobacteriaceae bacterium]